MPSEPERVPVLVKMGMAAPLAVFPHVTQQLSFRAHKTASRGGGLLAPGRPLERHGHIRLRPIGKHSKGALQPVAMNGCTLGKDEITSARLPGDIPTPQRGINRLEGLLESLPLAHPRHPYRDIENAKIMMPPIRPTRNRPQSVASPTGSRSLANAALRNSTNPAPPPNRSNPEPVIKSTDLTSTWEYCSLRQAYRDTLENLPATH